MQTVYLNGGIERFGRKWSTDCTNIRDIFKLIDCQTPGFRNYLLDAAENNVGFEIQRGSDVLDTPEELLLSLREEDIIITEVPAGSKSGAGKIIAAIAIVAFTLSTGGFGAGASGWAATSTATGTALTLKGTIALSVAMSLANAGVAQLLAPGPETEPPSENAGYLFGGPENVAPQGLPVPVLYGELLVGGSPVSVAYRHNSPFQNQTVIEENFNPYVISETEEANQGNNASTTQPAPVDGNIVATSDANGVAIKSAPTSHPDPEWLDNKREQEASQYDSIDDFISEQIEATF